VLYSATDSKSVSFKKGGTSNGINGLDATYDNSSNETTVTWSGGTGPFTVTSNGNPVGCANSGCVISGADASPGDKIQVIDSDGNSKKTTVSGP
jgi:hypothetical protein